MTSQGIWIGITVGLFFLGIGIGYTIFVNTNQMPGFGPMMGGGPMDSMMNNPQMQQEMMNQMMQDPQFMQQMGQMMNDPEFRKQMIQNMENHDSLMHDMMQDYEMREHMMGHMMEDAELMQNMGLIKDIKSHGGPVTDYVSLIDELRKSASVEPVGPIEQPFFTVVGQSILVNGENVQVFEYLTQAEANDDASNVSPDGHSIGLSMPLWVETPHFYKIEKIIVLYVGDNSATEELLESVLGSQFAGL